MQRETEAYDFAVYRKWIAGLPGFSIFFPPDGSVHIRDCWGGEQDFTTDEDAYSLYGGESYKWVPMLTRKHLEMLKEIIELAGINKVIRKRNMAFAKKKEQQERRYTEQRKRYYGLPNTLPGDGVNKSEHV